MQNQQIIRIIEICVILIALWPYVCLSYLTELKKITKELHGIKQELKKIREEEEECEDTSTEQIG